MLLFDKTQVMNFYHTGSYWVIMRQSFIFAKAITNVMAGYLCPLVAGSVLGFFCCWFFFFRMVIDLLLSWDSGFMPDSLINGLVSISGLNGARKQGQPALPTPNPSRRIAHYETVIKDTWKINWAQFDSEKNRLSTWRCPPPPSFQMLCASPRRTSKGRCINTLYWLDQDPWQLFVEIPSGRCSNSFTKNRTWHVINLNSLSIDSCLFC